MGCVLTASLPYAWGGGLSALGWGVYMVVVGGVPGHGAGGCTRSHEDGVYLVFGGVPDLGGSIPACTEADPHPVNIFTHTCKNITFAQLHCGQ